MFQESNQKFSIIQSNLSHILSNTQKRTEKKFLIRKEIKFSILE